MHECQTINQHFNTSLIKNSEYHLNSKKSLLTYWDTNVIFFKYILTCTFLECVIYFI